MTINLGVSSTGGNVSNAGRILGGVLLDASGTVTNLAGAVISGGSETLILSDGTHITLQGFTGSQAASFL